MIIMVNLGKLFFFFFLSHKQVDLRKINQFFRFFILSFFHAV